MRASMSPAGPVSVTRSCRGSAPRSRAHSMPTQLHVEHERRVRRDHAARAAARRSPSPAESRAGAGRRPACPPRLRPSPAITWPAPSSKPNGSLRSRELSNFVPFFSGAVSVIEPARVVHDGRLALLDGRAGAGLDVGHEWRAPGAAARGRWHRHLPCVARASAEVPAVAQCGTTAARSAARAAIRLSSTPESTQCVTFGAPARRTSTRFRRCTYAAGFESWPPSASAA